MLFSYAYTTCGLFKHMTLLDIPEAESGLKAFGFFFNTKELVLSVLPVETQCRNLQLRRCLTVASAQSFSEVQMNF